MQAYIFTRGQNDEIHKFIRDLQAQYFEYQTGVTPQDKKIIQLGVRPIQFWEIAFPKPCYDDVMRMMKPDILTTESKGIFRKVLSQLFKLKVLMGLKDFVPWKTKDDKGNPLPTRIVYHRNVDVKGLGLKEDDYKPIETI